MEMAGGRSHALQPRGGESSPQSGPIIPVELPWCQSELLRMASGMHNASLVAHKSGNGSYQDGTGRIRRRGATCGVQGRGCERASQSVVSAEVQEYWRIEGSSSQRDRPAERECAPVEESGGMGGSSHALVPRLIHVGLEVPQVRSRRVALSTWHIPRATGRWGATMGVAGVCAAARSLPRPL